MDKKQSRVAMLAFSGVLFGVSAFGWYIHSQRPAAVAPAAPVKYTAIAPNVLQQPAPIVASAATTPVEAPAARPVYPATTMEEAIRTARESIRRDPLAPLGAAQMQPVQTHPVNAYRGERVPPPPAMKLLNPPSVNDPSLQTAGQYYQRTEVAYEPQRHTKLSVDDFRLVGTIDGKGIFKIRRDIASELSLPSAFTLGSGECFNNIKVQSVEPDHATVSDGAQVATKELSRVH